MILLPIGNGAFIVNGSDANHGQHHITVSINVNGSDAHHSKLIPVRALPLRGHDAAPGLSDLNPFGRASSEP